jgi:hypothetical protein
MGTIRFDRHARRRMKWRSISEQEIFAAMEKPDRIETSVMGRKNVYKLMGDRNIKVTYRETSGEILVISAVDKGKRGKE